MKQNRTRRNVLARHADDWFKTGSCAGGSFLNRLFGLCAVADEGNLARLRRAFPAEVGAWVTRQHEGEIKDHLRVVGG